MKLLEHWVGSPRLQDKVVAELLEDALYEDIYTVSGQHRKLELLNFDMSVLECRYCYYYLE